MESSSAYYVCRRETDIYRSYLLSLPIRSVPIEKLKLIDLRLLLSNRGRSVNPSLYPLDTAVPAAEPTLQPPYS
jgi:hypothetical protein